MNRWAHRTNLRDIFARRSLIRAAPGELIKGTDQVQQDAALDGLAERFQLLGAAVWSAGEALGASRPVRR